jgi:predicted nucleotide-binding protein (sugar kinase/HSP70/actin superfamily)
VSSIRVGIPRTLAYYTYFPFYKTFFEELGVQVVVSRKSTKEILDAGVKETVSEACVPIKLFHGHVRDLAGRVDRLFIPRLVSVNRRAIYCPKFLGLPEMVRFSMKGLPSIIDCRVDLRKGPAELYKVCRTLAGEFTSSYRVFIRAFWRALRAWREYLRLLNRGLVPAEAFQRTGRRSGAIADDAFQRIGHPSGATQADARPAPRELPGEKPLHIAVLGYPYAVHDSYISLDLMKRLSEFGASIVTADMIPDRALERQASKFSKELFWTYSDMVTKAGYHFLEQGGVDGIIHVTAFGCGPDSMVNKMLELEAKRRGAIPFLSLMIDEQTGEAGLATRVEAFTDMLRRKERSG